MKNDLREKALQFVVKNNCASTVPLELVLSAMEIGAAHATHVATARLFIVRDKLKRQRELK